jgi:hypothetical protein
MANEISKLNDWVVKQYNLDALVNTISVVPTLSMDGNKENIYPLVNADLTEIDVQDQVLTGSYTMTIVSQRDKKPVKTDSKLLTGDNYIDNINETTSIAQRFINVLLRQNNPELIEAENISSLEVLKQWRSGLLDGVQFTIDLTIPNIGESL